MENRITVDICGEEYTFIADESPAYMQKVAELVDRKMSDILAGSKVGRPAAAVLAAMNVADQYLKELEASENLRRQLKENLEEANALKLELSEAKREIFKLGTRK